MQDFGSLADWVSGLGTLAAVLVALCSFWVVERQRAKDRHDAELGVAYELAAILINIANNILALEKHFVTERNDISVGTGRSALQFKVLNPLIGLSNEGEMQVPPGTTKLLVKAGAVELWNDVLLVVNQNRALSSIMKDYRDLWVATMAKMPGPMSFAGSTGHISASRDDFLSIQPLLIKLDAIVGALEVQIPAAVNLIKSVTGRIGPTFGHISANQFLHFSEASSEAG